MDSPLFVIVPLYIYPLEKAWEPLFHAARLHPRLQFLVIINPNNGPGGAAMPDASYASALRELSAFPNIRPIGYVHCTYGNRPIDEIKRDIDVYRGWNTEFRLDGIFVDEAPADPDLTDYMAELSQHANTTWETEFGRSSINIYNPGVVAHAAYFDSSDFIVTFEQSETHWNGEVIREALSSIPHEHQPKSVVIIHTCASDSMVADLVRQVKEKRFGGLYVTEQVGGGFTQWPRTWNHFLDALDSETVY